MWLVIYIINNFHGCDQLFIYYLYISMDVTSYLYIFMNVTSYLYIINNFHECD
jgi:hypothetical protein